MELGDGLRALALFILTLAVYLFGFKIYRWMMALLTAFSAGLVAALLVVYSAASQHSTVSQLLGTGATVFLIAGAAAFALAYFFQHVIAAIFNGVTTGAIVYILIGILGNSSSSAGHSSDTSIAWLFAGLCAIVAGFLTVKFYDYMAAVAVLSYWGVTSEFSQRSGISFERIVKSFTSGDGPAALIQDLLGGMAASLSSKVLGFTVAAAAVIWLRANCWTDRTSRARTELRPEWRGILLVTAVIMSWSVFWRSSLVCFPPVLAPEPIWPLMLLAFRRFVLPHAQGQLGHARPRLTLPERGYWVTYAGAAAVGLPLATALYVFLISDLPALAYSQNASQSVNVLSGYYLSFFDIGAANGPLSLILRWCSVGLAVPVLVDWARRATPANAPTNDTSADAAQADLTPRPVGTDWPGMSSGLSLRERWRQHWQLRRPQILGVAAVTAAVAVLTTFLVARSGNAEQGNATSAPLDTDTVAASDSTARETSLRACLSACKRATPRSTCSGPQCDERCQTRCAQNNGIDSSTTVGPDDTAPSVPVSAQDKSPVLEPAAAVGTLAPQDEGFVDRRQGMGWGDRCYIHIKKGNLDWAQAACERGLKESPVVWTEGALWYNLGLIAEKRGQPELAVQHFSKSLTVRPSGQGVDTVRAALARVSVRN